MPTRIAAQQNQKSAVGCVSRYATERSHRGGDCTRWAASTGCRDQRRGNGMFTSGVCNQPGPPRSEAMRAPWPECADRPRQTAKASTCLAIAVSAGSEPVAPGEPVPALHRVEIFDLTNVSVSRSTDASRLVRGQTPNSAGAVSFESYPATRRFANPRRGGNRPRSDDRRCFGGLETAAPAVQRPRSPAASPGIQSSTLAVRRHVLGSRIRMRRTISGFVPWARRVT